MIISHTLRCWFRRGLAAGVVAAAFLTTGRASAGDGLVIPGAGGAAPASQAAPVNTLMLKPEALFDPFAQMDAFTILVPDGWKMQGHVNWLLASPQLTFVDIAVFEPKSGAGLVIYPMRSYVDGVREVSIRQFSRTIGVRKATEIAEQTQPEGKDWMPGCPIRRQVPSPREYVRLLLVPQDRKDIANATDVKITAETDLPDLGKARAAELQLVSPVLQNANVEGRASKFRITYTSPEGQLIEEQFVCILINYPIGQGEGAITGWQAHVSSCRAPAGKLDGLLPLFATVETSATRQLPWYNFAFQMAQAIFQARLDAQRQGMQQMALDNAEHQKRMREIARKGSEDMSDRIRGRFKAEQDAKAASHHQFMNYVQDKQDYVNPRDKTSVTLPYGYKFNYVSTDGRVISTNDPTFKPPVDPRTSWDQLERAK